MTEPVDDEKLQRIVQRIAVLKRKGRDDTPEGHTSRLFAQKLELKYGLQVVLTDESDAPEDKPRVDTRALETELEPVWWRLLFLQSLATIYDCEAYVTAGEDKALWLLWLTGSPDQVHRCAIHYEFLVTQISRKASVIAAELSRQRIIRRRHKRTELEEGAAVGLFQNVLERLGIFPEKSTPEEGDVAFRMELVRQPLDENPTGFTMELVREPQGTDAALVPVNHRKRIEYEDAVDEEDQQVKLPTVVIDPPFNAIREGRGRGTSIRITPPGICFDSVDQLDIDMAVVRALQRAGIRSVYELMRKRPRQVRAIQGVGPYSLFRIQRALEQHGISLRKDW